MRKEKEMKRTLTFAAGLAAVYLHGATLDEARQVIRDYLEIEESVQKDIASGIRDSSLSAKQSQAWRAVEALRYDAFPAIYEVLQNEPENFDFIKLAMFRFLHVDGRNPASEGEAEAREWVRKFLERSANKLDEENETLRFLSSAYLALKGNSEKDIELLQRWGDYRDYGRILVTRLAGGNVLRRFPPVKDTSTPWFYASVTNTGPQAVYVHAILVKFCEQLRAAQEENVFSAWNLLEEVPEELMTMVVSFDKDGNPVCNVDLAKYGLSMPVITPKPAKHLPWWDDSYTVTFPPPNEYQGSASRPRDAGGMPFATRLPLYLAILCATTALAVWLLRKGKRKKLK